MSDGNDTKTKEQLLAEIAALKEQLAQREAPPAAPVPSGSMTRRESIVSWVAPVILSLPVLAVDSVFRPATAQAAATRAPTAAPTAKSKTAAPTAAPTAATMAPTKAGRCIVAPTAAPTIGMASTPDSRPMAAGFVPLGGARALASGALGL